MAVTLTQQVAAMQRAVVNLRGHVNNLANLSERGKRPKSEYEMAAAYLKDLEAAADTFQRVAQDERIVSLIEQQS